MSNPKNPVATPGGVPIPRSKRGLKGFFTEVSREMKKVTWPTRQETNRLTGVVIVICVGAVLLLLALHEAFHALLSVITKGF